MRIAIVNDQQLVIKLLSHVILDIIGHEVAWTAEDGKEAVEKCCDDTPDLVLMDLIMPVMNGVEATRRIMNECPCSILIVTASVNTSASMVFEAMGYGAVDAINTHSFNMSTPESANIIKRKIENIEKLLESHECETRNANESEPQPEYPLIAIGSSTGGPSALARVLSAFSADLPATVVIIQHVDKDFSNGLADWLDAQTRIAVSIAKEGTTPLPGHAYLAGTNNHLTLDHNRQFNYTEHPADCVYRPSVDVFFNSAAEHWNCQIIAALLTGMGSDGAKGMGSLREKGEYTIAQNEETCSVFGMPKAAIKIDAVCDVLPIDMIGQGIMDSLESSKANKRTAGN
jgi:two-component system response regulator WspF